MLNEFLIMALLAAGSVSGAWLLGVRSTLLAIPAGLIFATAARILVFATCNLFSIREFSAGAFYAVLAAALLIAALKSRVGLYRPVVIAVATGLASVFATRIIGFAATRHGDSYWILAVAHLMQKGGDMTILDGHTPLKRGFAYPLLLSLGSDDQWLTAITPYIFFALICAVAWLVLSLTKKYSSVIRSIVLSLMAVLSFSATLPLRAIFYINGHTLFAVALTVAAGVSVLAIRDQMLTRSNLLVICAAVFVATSTRAEGVAIMAVAILPIVGSRFVKRKQVALVLTSLTASFSIWQATYNSYLIPNGMPWVVFMLALIVAGLLPALAWFDWLRHRAFTISVFALAAIVFAAEIKWHTSFNKGLQALFFNLIYNLDTHTISSGGWGLIFGSFILLLCLAASGTVRLDLRRGQSWISTTLSPEFKLLMQISIALILGSLISKMLDGGQFGHPDLGRIGWSDSLNRMWLQSFGIFVVTVAVGLIQNDKIWQRSGAKNKGE